MCFFLKHKRNKRSWNKSFVPFVVIPFLSETQKKMNNAYNLFCAFCGSIFLISDSITF